MALLSVYYCYYTLGNTFWQGNYSAEQGLDAWWVELLVSNITLSQKHQTQKNNINVGCCVAFLECNEGSFCARWAKISIYLAYNYLFLCEGELVFLLSAEECEAWWRNSPSSRQGGGRSQTERAVCLMVLMKLLPDLPAESLQAETRP